MKIEQKIAAEIFEYMEDGVSASDLSDMLNALYNVDLSPEVIGIAYKKMKSGLKKIKVPEMELDMSNPHIRKVTKKVQFLDIETSLIEARVFRTGKQNINADQLTGTTRILTVAGGSMYDLYTKGEAGIWGHSNHHNLSTFNEDPLDDTFVLRKIWNILDKADTIVAHNARFDKGWLLGRFLELGWKLPSKFSVVCTFQNLGAFNMTSKKLDELSKNLIGTEKIPTDISLWMRCSDGDMSAFEEMLRYNKGDIFDTLFKVYMRTAQYTPESCVDLTDYSVEIPQCKVTGDQLVMEPKRFLNRTNGLKYFVYKNINNGLQYVDRYNVNSKKANIGLIKPHR